MEDERGSNRKRWIKEKGNLEVIQTKILAKMELVGESCKKNDDISELFKKWIIAINRGMRMIT